MNSWAVRPARAAAAMIRSASTGSAQNRRTTRSWTATGAVRSGAVTSAGNVSAAAPSGASHSAGGGTGSPVADARRAHTPVSPATFSSSNAVSRPPP